MKKSFAAIKNDLQVIWPELNYALPTDQYYWLPNLDEVQRFLDHYDPVVKRIKGIYECEEFSLGLMVDLRRWRAVKGISSDFLNWAVGVVLTIKSGLMGESVHYQNIAVTSDAGVILIEPQTAMIIDNKKVTEVHFVLM
jgi:hypothetical protein